MRSPPAHTSIAASSLLSRYSVDDYESDGSASPELGVDDVIPQAPPPSNAIPKVPTSVSVPTSNATSITPATSSQISGTSTPVPKRVAVPPPPQKSTPQRSSLPIPPPLPQKKEKVLDAPERTASPVVKQENVKPAVPRPTPVSPLKPAVPKRETSSEPGLVEKSENSREIKNCIEENDKTAVVNSVKPPPIRLKLKFDGAKAYIENNENSDKDGERKQRKHKKKKKERDKLHKDAHDRIKMKHHTKGSKKHKIKDKLISSPQELVAVTKNGKRLKVKFGLGGSDSRCTTPGKLPLSTEESDVHLSKELPEQQPSSSKTAAHAPAEPLKIPRLRIRIGDSPALVIAPVKEEPPQTAHKSHHHHHHHRHSRPTSADGLVKPVKTVTVPVNSNPLSVEFSDDSDTEAERIRSATDEALRGLANMTDMHQSNNSLLPWSTHPAP
ncbi:unnamed protein product [Cylicostephanus goldi]|uniref:Uncharacterized protein n=1 Tax=Cylicostephanus goldi TaxID=71465 RepID=A0A3P6QM27_CYLGO|nr:unnamed protein product [Cylicostephanus goldi]